MKPSVSSSVLSDFGGFISDSGYLTATPTSLEDVSSLVCWAYRQNLPIKLRGNGHSMNGLSLPKKNELLLDTSALCHFRFDTDEFVTVGSGAAVWDVNLALRKYGRELLVYNDGNAPASTLGGFLSAGGIGATSNQYGGFWNTVEEVTLVVANGEVRKILRSDPEFKWLFGSMGQLGVVVEMKLRHQSFEEPGLARVSESYQEMEGNVAATHYDWEKIIWFTLFVPVSLRSVVANFLKELDRRHHKAWSGRAPYFYALPYRDFNPPLIHPHQGPLVAMGVWGGEPDGGFDPDRISKVEQDIDQFVATRPTLIRRYAQTELLSPDYYQGYFDPDVFAAFKELKRVFDPKFLFSPGVIPPVV